MLHREFNYFTYFARFCVLHRIVSARYDHAVVERESDDNPSIANEGVQVSRIVVVGMRNVQHAAKSLGTHLALL